MFLAMRLEEIIERHMNEQLLQNNNEGQGEEGTNGGQSIGGAGTEFQFDASACKCPILKEPELMSLPSLARIWETYIGHSFAILCRKAL